MKETSMKEQTRKEHRAINRPVFDMIRSAAALMVFTIHFLEYRNVPVPNFVFVFFRHCGFGVSLFFVISGYLIMQSLENSKNTKEYFLKRALRLIPSYYVILIAAVIIWGTSGAMPKDTMLGLGWARYFLFLNGIVPSNDYFFWNDLWGLWTMSCFMLFYLLAPLVKRWVKSYRASLVLVFAAVAAGYLYKEVVFTLLNNAGVSHAEEFAGNSAVFNMMSFSFGTAAWYAVREGKDRQYLSLVVIALAGFLAIRDDTYNRIIWSLLTAAFMVAMKEFSYGKRTQWIGRVFSFFSRYSFTVYLVHMPVFSLLQHFGSSVRPLGFAPFLALALIFTALSAAALYHLVERPAAAFIKRRT